jgi:BASS family bile acid:Na+ symporter
MALPKILALIMIVSTMLGAGLQVDRQRLTETLRNVSLLVRALLANFVLVPLFAFVLVRALHVDNDVSVGILLMAMAPGVPFLVNSAGRKQGGSLAFAIEIAFLFSALSVVTIPLTAELVFPANALAEVPAQNFLTTLVAFQLLPLVAGALIAPRLRDAQVTASVKALHVVFLVAVAVLTVLIFPKIVASVESVYGFGRLLIIVCIGALSIVTGWFLGGPDSEYRRTLSIATLLRNIGLCTLVATEGFAGTLVGPTVITYFVVTFVLSIPTRIYLQRTHRAAQATA